MKPAIPPTEEMHYSETLPCLVPHQGALLSGDCTQVSVVTKILSATPSQPIRYRRKKRRYANSRPNRVGSYHSLLGASELPHEALKDDSFVLDASRRTIGRLRCMSSLMNIEGYQDVKSVMTNAFRTFRGHAQRKRSVVGDAEVTDRTLKMSSLHRQPKSCESGRRFRAEELTAAQSCSNSEASARPKQNVPAIHQTLAIS